MSADYLYSKVGSQLRAARVAKGMSRRALAAKLQVHVSSLSAWEAGSRLPREEQRSRLAWTLGIDLAVLFPDAPADGVASLTVSLVDPTDDLPDVLVDCLSRSSRRLRGFRFAAPYCTAAYVQVAWRKLIDKRLRDASLRVERAEIVYSLERLKEILSNIIRYDGLPYYVKAYGADLGDVAPFMGGYMFDDREFLLGAYWTGVPPIDQPSLRFSGGPFAAFFNAYWNEIWRRGVLLNMRGDNDLQDVKTLAFQLGLAAADWPYFVEQARNLVIGDGAPPLF